MSKPKNTIKLLLVDDEIEFLNSTAKALRRRGFDVTTLQDPEVGLKIFEHERFDVAVLDVKMPEISGDQLFRQIKIHWPEMPVIMLTGHGTVEQAFETSKEGVFDYLTKPCDLDVLARVCRDAVSMPKPIKTQELKPGGDKIRVLVIDDEQDFLDSLTGLLQRRNMRVQTARSGQQALERIREDDFHVVLLDLKMPGMGGRETLQSIKNANPALEVILLTGHPTARVVVECLRDGAFDYLAKPQDNEMLIGKIHEAYRKARLNYEKPRSEK